MPFIIYALPRSRTAWLSRFLTYNDYTCYHEQAIFARSLSDIKTFFKGNMGTAETAAAQGRPLIHYVCPDIKEVVILRPVNEVVESMIKAAEGIAAYNKPLLQRNMEYGDRQLRKMAKDPNVLCVDYADLQNEKTCAMIFEYCLPYQFDKDWWEFMKNKNVQANVGAIINYYHRHRADIEGFKRHCKSELRRLCYDGQIPMRKKKLCQV